MGLEPAPLPVNLFLHHYESRWICQFRKSDIIEATRFNNVFPFIDNLTAKNDGGEYRLF